MLKKHYSTISKPLIEAINEFYKDDFEAFGYDPNYYVAWYQILYSCVILVEIVLLKVDV